MTRNEMRLKDRLYGKGNQLQYSKPGKEAIKATMGKSTKTVGFRSEEDSLTQKPLSAVKWPI